MRIFPAIDIQGGRCVRLRRGDFLDSTVFNDDPVDVAIMWEKEGARHLHVVDLDGARTGELHHLALVRRIVEAVSIPVQFGGGLRSEAALASIAATGVRRVIIGTNALLDRAFLDAALAGWGERLIVAVDAADGYVSTHGWREKTEMTAKTFARHLAAMGVKEIIYTDISRDGMLGGINIRATENLAREAPGVQIIASGGLSTLDDLRALKSIEPLGVTGVIAGRALYEAAFTLQEALAVLDGLEV